MQQDGTISQAKNKESHAPYLDDLAHVGLDSFDAEFEEQDEGLTDMLADGGLWVRAELEQALRVSDISRAEKTQKQQKNTRKPVKTAEKRW